MKNYYVYILGNQSGTLYTGVTNNLENRLEEHKQNLTKGFTRKYQVNRLLYFQEFNDVNEAIAAEKQIKGWLRKKKMDLIRSINPTFVDLSNNWHES